MTSRTAGLRNTYPINAQTRRETSKNERAFTSNRNYKNLNGAICFFLFDKTLLKHLYTATLELSHHRQARTHAQFEMCNNHTIYSLESNRNLSHWGSSLARVEIIDGSAEVVIRGEDNLHQDVV